MTHRSMTIRAGGLLAGGYCSDSGKELRYNAVQLAVRAESRACRTIEAHSPFDRSTSSRLRANELKRTILSLGMGDEVPIVHDIRWPISSLAKIASSYRARRGDPLTPSPLAGEGGGEGCTGFCRSAKLEDIRKHDHALTPGRYVGAEAADDDDEPFDEKMKRTSPKLTKQLAEAVKLDEAIHANLAALGFPIENEP